MGLALIDWRLEIERYQLSSTMEAVWDVTFDRGGVYGTCVHRWLVVAIWKARWRALQKMPRSV